MSQEEENKAVVRRLVEEVINAGNLGAADELYAPDYASPDASASGDARGPEVAKRLVAAYRAAYPDFSMTVEDELAEGDKVATRYVARGTHEGESLRASRPPGGGSRSPASAYTGSSAER